MANRSMMVSTFPAGTNTVIGGSFFSVDANMTPPLDSTDGTCQFKNSVAGTVSGMNIHTQNVGNFFKDSTHTDHIASGDLINFATLGSMTINGIGAVFTPDSGNAVGFFQGPDSNAGVGSNSLLYLPFTGGRWTDTVEANRQVRIRAAGTLSNFQVNLATNTRTTPTTFNVRVNGANTGNTVTFGAGVTGLRSQDTPSNTTTLLSGDLVSTAMLGGGGVGSVFNNGLAFNIVSNDSRVDIVGTNNTVNYDGGTGTMFIPIKGHIDTQGNEQKCQIIPGFPMRLSRMRIFIQSNTLTQDFVVTLNKNTVAQTQTFIIPSGATGWQEDTTHTDDFLATDKASISIQAGGSGTIFWSTSAITAQDIG